MAIDTYNNLVQAVYDWVKKETDDQFLTTTRLNNCISLAEGEINRRLRMREMRTYSPLNITASVAEYDLPDAFRRVDTVYYADLSGVINFKPKNEFQDEGLQLSAGKPSSYYLNSATITLGPIPDAEYQIILGYYGAITGLSSIVTTNPLLLRYPDLYFFAVLKQVYILLEDKEQERDMDSRFEKVINEVKMETKRDAIALGTRGTAKSII